MKCKYIVGELGAFKRCGEETMKGSVYCLPHQARMNFYANGGEPFKPTPDSYVAVLRKSMAWLSRAIPFDALENAACPGDLIAFTVETLRSGLGSEGTLIARPRRLNPGDEIDALELIMTDKPIRQAALHI